MKQILTALSLTLICFIVRADSGSFIVKGDIDKYYPVVFTDGNYWSNIATELELGRSNVHIDASWRGALIAKFRYHTTNYGNGANFIDADIRDCATSYAVIKDFVAGWRDATVSNGEAKIIIWLRGGTTTYYFKANGNTLPVVYDGVQNALPLQETNGPAHTYKTAIDSYVNNNGSTMASDLFVKGITYHLGNVGIGIASPIYPLQVVGTISSANNSSTTAQNGVSINAGNTNTAGSANVNRLRYGGNDANATYFSIQGPGDADYLTINNGNVGMGTTDPKGYKLAVNGSAIFTKAVVKNYSTWPDYVFDSTYELPSLESVSSFIKENKHLPEMPSATSIEKDGHDLGEVQKVLLKKVEELTLYLIDLKKENEMLKEKVEESIKKNELGTNDH